MFLTTLSTKLRIARNEANEDGVAVFQNGTALLDLTTKGNYPNMPALLGSTGVGVIDIIPDKHESVTFMKANGIEFYFCAGDAAGDHFGWRILAWRVAGPARLVAVGTAELGTQQVITYPHDYTPYVPAVQKYWADHLTVTWYNWPKRVKATDVGNSNSSATIWLDDCGHRFFKIEITGADGKSLGEAEDVAAYWGAW